jgi:lysophospholipase L1-like esterase
MIMKKKLKWYSVRWQAIVLVFFIILLATGYFYCRFRFLISPPSMGSGPAGPEVPPESFSEIWSEEELVLIGVGDSITNGFGAPGGLGYFDLLYTNDNTAWPQMKGRDLRTVLPNLKAKNYSQDYTVTREHIDFQLARINKYPKETFGIVVITSGGNDLIHNYGKTPPEDGAIYGCTFEQGVIWTDNIKQRIKILLEGLILKFPGRCQIFLANIYDPTDGVSDPENAGLPPLA